jgi:hypothetical protein
MRAREGDAPTGAGASFGVEHGVVGIGEATDERSARRLHRFAELPDGVFVWTRTGDGAYRLGRISGPIRPDDSPAARRVGVRHVRPTEWLDRALDEREAPAGVAATFARGGRNFQRIHDDDAERLSAALWEARGRA